MPDREAEVLRLRGRISALMDEAAHNERLLKKTQQRELELLKTQDLPQLFEVICNQLAVSFGLPRVTLVLGDAEHEIRHLLLGAKVQLKAYPRVLFLERMDELQALFKGQPQPWLGPYTAARHRFLFTDAGGQLMAALRSVALIPLWQRQQLLGCICFGSPDERRFTRQLATDFLAHLGVTASFALDNTMNRARLVRSGVTDFLTGWHNRRYLQERLKEELPRAARTHEQLACIVLDLDHFKQINDTHGHLVGDLALREAAERIRHQVRDSDTAARFGGDEFVVLAPAISVVQATQMAERMRQGVAAQPLQLAGVQHQFTISVGVAVLTVTSIRHEDIDALAEHLFATADAALYRAKQRGRNCVEVAVCP